MPAARDAKDGRPRVVYLYETPENRMLTTYWNLVWEGRLAEAIAYNLEMGIDRISEGVAGWFCHYPGRPDYFTHWGEAYRYAASVIGLPMGDYPHSRPPQGILPEIAKEQIRATFQRAGLAKQLAEV